MADERIVFDAGTQVITIARRYPWQSSETEESRPFAAVDSIGVNRDESGEAEIVYTVYLRLKTRRRVYLWTIRPRGSHGRELITFLETDPDLESLQRLTGFRREDRLGRAALL